MNRSLNDHPLKATLYARLDQWIAEGQHALANGEEVTLDQCYWVVSNRLDLTSATVPMEQYKAQLLITAILIERAIKTAPLSVQEPP